MAASRRTLKALLRRSSQTELAAVFGVSSSTISRWSKTGKIPSSYGEKFAVAMRGAKSREREEKRALRGDAGALAIVYGVTERTAKRWKRAGKIPTRYRGVIKLLEPEILGPTPKRFRTGVRSWEKGRATKAGVVFTIDVNEWLDPMLARHILQWAGGVRDSFGPKARRAYQMGVRFQAPQDFEVLVNGENKSYGTIAFDAATGPWKRGDFRNLVLSTSNWHSREKALREMRELLAAADDQGAFVEQAWFYIKVPKDER